MGAAVVAVLIRKEKGVVQQFLDARATSAASARSLDELQLDENTAVRRLRRREIIREGSPGLYYLDEPVWNAVHKLRRRAALLVLLVLAVATLVALAASRYGGGAP